MASVDITHHILGFKPGDWHLGRNRKNEIVSWLNDNVGEYYGHGEHPVTDIGSGWEIVVLGSVNVDGVAEYELGWAVDFADDSKATMFALVWA